MTVVVCGQMICSLEDNLHWTSRSKMEPVAKGLRFARHNELDHRGWAQPLKACTEQHDAEASGPSAR